MFHSVNQTKQVLGNWIGKVFHSVGSAGFDSILRLENRFNKPKLCF